jgi:hypothetical protein
MLAVTEKEGIYTQTRNIMRTSYEIVGIIVFVLLTSQMIQDSNLAIIVLR